MPFQNDLQNRCSEFKLFLQNIHVKKMECMHVSKHTSQLLNDSELLDLGSAFNHYQSLGT